MLFIALAAAALAVESVEPLEPVDLSGPVLAVGLSLVGGVRGNCPTITPGVRLGYRFEAPFAPDRPRLGGAVFRPEVGLRGMPCQGGSLFTGGRMGLRGGPIELGVYTHVGAAVQFEPRTSTTGSHLNTGVGGYAAAVTVPVELMLHWGLIGGHLDEAFLDLGVTVGWRF